MADIDWKNVLNSEQVKEISQVIARFNVLFENGPHDLVIEIQEHYKGPGGKSFYLAVSNYSFLGPKNSNAYQSGHLKTSIEQSLNDSIMGLLTYSKDLSPEVMIWVKQDPNTLKKTYLDGNLNYIDYDEVKKRLN